MATEFEKTLTRLNVTFTSKEVTGTPAQGFKPEARYWRTSLVRKVRNQENPLRLTLTLVSEAEPTAETVVQALNADMKAAEMTQWDFAQAFANGKISETTERMLKSCKRIGPRVAKFFGEQWPKVVAVTPSKAA